MNDYIPAYTLVHLGLEDIILGKLEALVDRHKPRDFYDYFFFCQAIILQQGKRTSENSAETSAKGKTNFQTGVKEISAREPYNAPARF